MPLENGGRADKMGNRYEIRCIIYSSEALAVCMEMIRQVRYLNDERAKKIVIISVISSGVVLAPANHIWQHVLPMLY